MSEVKNPVDAVKGPGIGLLIVGIIGVGLGVLGLLDSVFGFGFSRMQMEQMQQSGQQMPEWAKGFFGGTGVLHVFTNLLTVASGCFVAFAGLQMQKLQGATLCMIASIVAMVPCISPCCCVGLPIGIWALLTLNKPEVKAAFGTRPMS